MRRANRSGPEGVLLVDKAPGETSFDVVRKVRRAARTKKVGHGGTLDPFSTGLLVLMLGQATKLSPFIMAGDKRYLATIRLGVETDTHDPEGRVVREGEVPDLDEARIQEVLNGFLGEISQVPPVFSAVRVDGERAYKLARQGVEFTLDERTVTIYEARVRAVDLPEFTVEVACSSGTYLRSLAFDLGRALGTTAHLSFLRRLESGGFRVEDALSSESLTGSEGAVGLEEHLIPLFRALPAARRIKVDQVLAKKIRNGYQPAGLEMGLAPGNSLSVDETLRVVCGDDLVAVAKVIPSPVGQGGRPRIMRVFN
ncbi:MAG: tRNA pseudouridine(55) synthase TruB [Desulfobacteraceae bacterium]